MSIEFYNINAVEFFNNTVSADMTETYEEFLKHVKPKGKILDAGCGSGRDTVFFLGKGFSVVSLNALTLPLEKRRPQTILLATDLLNYRNSSCW